MCHWVGVGVGLTFARLNEFSLRGSVVFSLFANKKNSSLFQSSNDNGMKTPPLSLLFFNGTLQQINLNMPLGRIILPYLIVLKLLQLRDARSWSVSEGREGFSLTLNVVSPFKKTELTRIVAFF